MKSKRPELQRFVDLLDVLGEMTCAFNDDWETGVSDAREKLAALLVEEGAIDGPHPIDQA